MKQNVIKMKKYTDSLDKRQKSEKYQRTKELYDD